MDIKPYDEKVKELQSYLPFLENFIRNLAATNATDRLPKFNTLYELVDGTRRGQRLAISTIIKAEKTIKEIKMRWEAKITKPIHNVSVKKEVIDTSDKSSVCETISETPDSPSPTRHYERTSPIEIPTERSDDRDSKIKREKDSHRYEDDRRFNQRSERTLVDKYSSSRFNSGDRNRSRYDQHETSKSRDRNRNDRRERSDSSERARYGRNDRNRNRHDDRDSRDSRDSWDNSRMKYDNRNTDRVIKTERSDRYSPSSQRDSGRPGKNLENEFHKMAFNRVGTNPTSTNVPKPSDDDRFTEEEIANLKARNKKLYGNDSDEEVSDLKNLEEVRSKLANQIKRAESMRAKEKPSTSTAVSSGVSVPSKKTGSRFELNSLRECTPTPPSTLAKENPSKFSFLRTLSQSSRVAETVSNVHIEPQNSIRIDDDIINKVVALPIQQNNRAIPPLIQDMNIIKQALETAKNQQRLALKYNPKVKPRPEQQNVPETITQSHHHHQPDPSNPNNLQLVCFNDPRVSRDPRVQVQQQDLRLQPFSPPSTPPCIPNYPPIIQSSSGYKQSSYPKSGLLPPPNHFPTQQNAYNSTISPQHHLQSQSNLISISTHASSFNNHRSHQASPVSSSDVSPPPRYQYQPPSFPEHNRNSSGIHNKFRPSLNDNVERQKYEQSRSRRSSDYYERETQRDIPSTYGEYRRSLQSNVSSTSEKSERVNSESRSGNISKSSYHDKVYRSGNYATPIPTVTTHPTGSKFKIPKKSANETGKLIHATENCDSKDSEDEHSNVRAVKDSDDSEHEVSGNAKKFANNDCEPSDIRDPRMRMQALKKASSSVENKTKESAEKQNNVVTSSTSIAPENVSTPDNMEFLKHLTNPNNLLALINLVGQMSDDATFTKVKEVLEKAKETNVPAVSAEENVENPSTSMTQDKLDVPKTPRKKSKNELEKLNEDIRTMFISDGVLNATGRRVCALYNNNAADAKESTVGKNAKPAKRQAKDDVAIEKKSQPENRITRRRNTMISYTEPSGRTLRPLTKDADTAKEPVTPGISKSTTQASKTAAQEVKTTKTAESKKITTESKKTTPESKKTAPESKKTTAQEQKTANVPTKGAKAKKPFESTDKADEPPTKRITRAQLKECNIVLEKISPDASVESLTCTNSPKKDGKGKRLRIEGSVKKAGVKKAKQEIMKNINPEFHSLKKLVDCQLCDKPAKLSIVNHYVTVHPDSEVIVSRLAPEVADALRNSKVLKVAERIQPAGRNYPTFSHLCYFCNVTKCLTKIFWMNHMAKHTGYYQYECNDCSRKFAEKNKAHTCKDKNNLSKIPQPQFHKDILKGFVCNLCNFVRLNRADIEKHLRCEHETTVTDQFEELVFLNFPTRQKKGQIEEEEGEEAEEEVDEEQAEASDNNDDEEILNSSSKRRKVIPDSDDKDKIPEKVLRSRVVHTEAFISEPKEDDGLFDKDTMKLMKDMSFSASKDGECTTRSNRAKSIAEKLSERFNSVQEDSTCKPEEEKVTKAEPLDPMNCDEGIPIIRVTAIEDCAEEERNVDVPKRMEISKAIEKASPSSVTTSSRDKNCTPTEEFVDESDDNWESYSSDDSDDDSADAVDETASAVIQRQPNRKNVGIIDTIARLQQSISSQSTNNVEGVEKLPEISSQDDEASVKDETASETISIISEQQIDPETSMTQSVEEATNGEKTIDVAKAVDGENKVPVTYETIVSEAMQIDAEDAERSENIRKCVSNGRSSNSSYSFNFKGTEQSASQLGSQNLGGSSSNADSTNIDVEMVDAARGEKILTRIDNIGYTRAADSSVSFCCLIDDCGFESFDLTNLLYHINEHPVEWFGYCFTCDDQVGTDRVPLMMEFKHMTTVHYQKNDDSELTDKSSNAGKPGLIKCKLLPGDKLSKLREEEEIAAKAKKLIKKSTSAAKVETTFLKIASVTSLTANMKVLTATGRKPKTMPMIKNVMSLGSTSREYKESEVVALKEWANIPTNKLQKNCKKMLRDICLYALFKCMDINCSFTTDNAEHMLTHLRSHENVSSEPSWLECAYCDIVADSCALLVKHIQDEHQSSIFQCPYCFYRSCAAFNVVVHLKLFHSSEKKSVLVCNGKPRMYSTEKALIEKFRIENIRPLRCTEDCNKITYVMDHFVNHMKVSPAHNDKFKCQFCGFYTLVSETSKHMLCHSVGVYECVYCHYGINDVESIQNHMCNTHPSKLLYICVRLTRKDRVLSDVELSSLDSTLIFHLGQAVDNKLFQRCPFTDEQLSFMDPIILSNSNVTETAVASNPIPPSTLNASSIGLNIASVTSISSESFANPTETVTALNTGLMLNDVLSYKDLEKDYMHDDWDKYFATLATTTKEPAVPKRKSSVSQARVELPENKKASTSSTSRTELLQDEIDNAAYVLVKGTGLEGRDLYRCSFANCEERCNDIFVFNVHLLKHNQAVNAYKCFHCNVVSKNIVGLKYHIKVHGIHRFFCYYCNYTSAIVNDIHKHMQDTHGKSHVNTVPLNPKKQDQNKDMFVMCPRGLFQEELNRFGVALINRNKRQLTSTKKFYSPDDMESLPRQAIFNSLISCEVCDYSTKVRTNMYRHLAGHKDDKSVPKIDPVNPVPCLDTGEKHFDKMINLACSSNDGKTLSAQLDSTAFIPEGRRFVCNARNCQYQNISENMLNRHLTTLHPNEEQYKCPHCNSLICQKMDADKVIFHLRMHDSKIYKCPKCVFAHHVKSIVEKHKDEVHPGVSDQAMLITRDETTSNVLDGQPKVSKWKCSLCNDLFATQKQIQAHIQTLHSIKFQYQCDICSEVQSNNKTNIQDHINLKHPNQGSRIKVYYTKVECVENDNTPIWRRDDPNKIKHIRGILFEEENVRKTTTATKRDQSEVKKKTSQKKRSDKPVVEQNSDIGHVAVIEASEQTTKSTEGSESNAIVIISDEDTTDVEKATRSETPSTAKKSTSISNPIPSTSKNLLESGKSLMGSSKTAPMKPSQTVVRAEATSSGIKSKKEPSLDKAYLCGRCCKYSDNTIALVRAHQATAHPNVVCEVFMRNTNNGTPLNKNTTKPLPDATIADPKPNFSDSINYVCYHCIFKSQYPTIIYKHWKENHKFPKITTKNIEFPSRPFMFRILRTYQCCYCRRCSHYKDLKVHCLRNHPLESFAMINNLDPKKCALCIHKFTTADTKDVIDHFKTSHKNLTSIEPENGLTDELIEEVTSLLPRDQVKCTQPNCNIVFFSMAEFDSHTIEKHPGCQVKFVSIPNDPIMYGCVHCSETMSVESNMVAHIRNHILQYQCNFCSKRFNHLEMIKVHHEIMHNSKDETYRNIDVDEHFHKYAAMKIIFPNGFVLTKYEAKHTKYGVMEHILKLVTEIDIRDLEVVRKRQEEHNEKSVKDLGAKDVKGVKSVIVKKKNLKRLRISDSDSDSNSDDMKPLIQRKKLTPNSKSKPVAASKSSNLKRKVESSSASDENTPLKSLILRSGHGKTSQSKSNAKPDTVSSDSKMEAKSATLPSDSKLNANSNGKSDDCKPLQAIPFSNYGKKPEPVDLSKLFIDMPFGNSSVKVSCDRFALLFNINPKLRLKRCDKLMTK